MNSSSPEVLKAAVEGSLPCAVGRLDCILEVTFHLNLL